MHCAKTYNLCFKSRMFRASNYVNNRFEYHCLQWLNNVSFFFFNKNLTQRDCGIYSRPLHLKGGHDLIHYNNLFIAQFYEIMRGGGVHSQTY